MNELIEDCWQPIKKDLIKNEQNPLTKRAIMLKTRESQVHVLPNIGIIILSLLYGAQNKEDPLGRSICVAGMMGYDTDCNCGNIGAIIGAQIGADAIPSKWKDPLQDTFSTYVIGHEKWKISELARRISNIGSKVIDEKCRDTVGIINSNDD